MNYFSRVASEVRSRRVSSKDFFLAQIVYILYDAPVHRVHGAHPRSRRVRTKLLSKLYRMDVVDEAHISEIYNMHSTRVIETKLPFERTERVLECSQKSDTRNHNEPVISHSISLRFFVPRRNGHLSKG